MASSSSTSFLGALEAPPGSSMSMGGGWNRKSAPSVLIRPSRLCPTLIGHGGAGGLQLQQGMTSQTSPPSRSRPKSLGSEAEKRTAEGLMALFGMGPYGRLMRPSLPVGPAAGGGHRGNQDENGHVIIPLQNRSNGLAVTASGPSFDQENRDRDPFFQNYKQDVEAELRMRDGAIQSLREAVRACQTKMLEMKLEKDAYGVREAQVFQEIQQDVLNLLHRVNSFVEREGLDQYSNSNAPTSGFPGLSRSDTTVNGEGAVDLSKLLDKLNNMEERMVNMERNNEDLLATCKSTEDTFKIHMMQTSDKLDQLANLFMGGNGIVSEAGPGPSGFEDSNHSSQSQPSVPYSPARSIRSQSQDAEDEFIVPNDQYEEAPPPPLDNILAREDVEFEVEVEADNILEQQQGGGEPEDNILDQEGEADDNIYELEEEVETEDNIVDQQEEEEVNGDSNLAQVQDQEVEYSQEQVEDEDFVAEVEVEEEEKPDSDIIEVVTISPLPVEVILHSEPSPARSSHSSEIEIPPQIQIDDGDRLGGLNLDDASNNPHHEEEVNQQQEQNEAMDIKSLPGKRKRLTMDSSAELEEKSSLEDGECSDSDDDDKDSLPPILSLPSRIVKDPTRRMPILLPESIPLGPRPLFGSHIVDEKIRKEVPFRQIIMHQRKKIKPRRNLSSEFKENIPPMSMQKLRTSAPGNGNMDDRMAKEGARRVVVGIRREKESSTIGQRHARDFSKAGYACLCGSKFTGAGGLYVHQVKQMEFEKFACGQCGKRFHYFSGLKAHRKATHKMEFSSQVGCSRCGQVFDSKKKRQGHRDARGQTCWLSGSYQSKNWELIRNKRVRHQSFGSSSMNILKTVNVGIPK